MVGRRPDSNCHFAGSRARADLLAIQVLPGRLEIAARPCRRSRKACRAWRLAQGLLRPLRRGLAWVDKGLGPSAWSAESYEFTLTMAFIYPFASLLIVWIVTGQNTSGISALLPEDLAFWRCALAATRLRQRFLCYRFVTSSGWRSSVLRSLAVAGSLVRFRWFAVAGAVVVAVAVAGVGAGAGVVAFAVGVLLLSGVHESARSQRPFLLALHFFHAWLARVRVLASWVVPDQA